ncbi:DNA damage-inducible protein I [Obesumbacterium proteus]|uniref:DNA damage-inducible protein I n=1 Tax=Obesumbacterium proteus TaxID=82983 RepID=UPI00242C166E|nr:DNA damage-inducible protein I [Obesumbacterium proteus]
MRIELTLDKRNKLPEGALEALNHEFSKRVNHIYPDTAVQVRMTNSNTLTVMGGLKSDKERIEEVLQETWESADDWFDNGFSE